MQRPRITLHILTSLDGRITGDFSQLPASKQAGNTFRRLGFDDVDPQGWKFDGWLYGRVTSEGYFTKGHQPVLQHNAQPVEIGDFITGLGASKYYIAFDRNGVLGWIKPTTAYEGYQANIIELLTNQASNEYKAYLRQLKIPYLLCGESDIDIGVALTKLRLLFGLKHLMLGGGGILNWSFLEQGYLDDISLIVAPAVDGRLDTARLFNAQFDRHTRPIGFKLKSATVIDENTLWLRYQITHSSEQNQLRLSK